MTNRRRVGLLTAVFLLPACISSASPIGIDVLSSGYHIWGDVSYDLTFRNASREITGTDVLFHSYDITSSVPVTHSEQAIGTNVSSSSAGEFFVDASSSAHLAIVGTLDGGEVEYNPLRGGNKAFADASWIFQTSGTMLLIDLDAHFIDLFSAAQLRLTDVSSGTSLLALNCASFGCFVDPIALEVDPTHIYDLSMFSSANARNDSHDARIGATLRSVPEPSTAMLFGLAFGGWALTEARRRRARRGAMQR